MLYIRTKTGELFETSNLNSFSSYIEFIENIKNYTIAIPNAQLKSISNEPGDSTAQAKCEPESGYNCQACYNAGHYDGQQAAKSAESDDQQINDNMNSEAWSEEKSADQINKTSAQADEALLKEPETTISADASNLSRLIKLIYNINELPHMRVRSRLFKGLGEAFSVWGFDSDTLSDLLTQYESVINLRDVLGIDKTEDATRAAAEAEETAEEMYRRLKKNMK